ncbi:MAG: phosphohydrolase [Eubacteriales bacterium]
MKQKSIKEFACLIRDITHSEDYRVMKERRHHVKGSVYDHSVKVAYLCYRHYKRFGTKIALPEFIRGALLHDYYLYDRHNKAASPRFHGFVHPRYALGNAKQRYPDLTRIERDMILRHMFPLTPIPPRTKAGWLICFYDKVAAVSDYFGKNKWKKRASLHRKTAAVPAPVIPLLPAPEAQTALLLKKPYCKGT